MTCTDCATEIARLRAELAAARHAAITDPLTGLPNRAGFETHRARIVDVPHTVLLIDVDRFKTVNDTYGHATGDLVLRAVAERMRRACADGRTFVARLSGDEFAATVLGDPDLGRDVARRITEAVAGPVATPSGGRVWPSVSVGVAWHRPGDDPAATLHTADDAMYATKAGRPEPVLVAVELPHRARNSRFAGAATRPAPSTSGVSQ